MVTVALIISRSVTRSMRRPRDACPMEEMVNDILGAGHCIRVGLFASSVQGWKMKKRQQVGKERGGGHIYRGGFRLVSQCARSMLTSDWM